jgi:UDP-N-acetylmuramoylalanine--D-glutamate ligase
MLRVESLSSWQDDWAQLSAVVWGLGEEGFDTADTLVELGVSVSVLADTEDSDRMTILDVLGVSTRVVSRDQWLDLTRESMPNLVIITPTVQFTAEEIAALRGADVAVWTPLELAFRVADKVEGGPRIVLVGGGHARQIADLAHQLLLVAGLRSFRGGVDIAPALDAIRLPDGLDVLIVDVTQEELQVWKAGASSTRRPYLAVCVEDEGPLAHELLLELYRDTIAACVYRRGSGATEKAVEDAWVIEGCRAIGVGLDSPGMSDLGRVDDIVCDRAFLDDRADRALELCTTEELKRAGLDSAEHALSALAAFAIARAFQVAPELIGQELGRWGGRSE